MICRYCKAFDRVVPGKTDAKESVCPLHRLRNWNELKRRADVTAACKAATPEGAVLIADWEASCAG